MDPILNEWLHLALRWIHITTAIAWVGTSFFFNFLDLAVKDPKPKRENVEGEAWLIHAGAFYQMDKMLVNRDIEPTQLGWESQGTWWSGMGLLILIYYVSASLYLVEPSSGFSAGETIAIGVITIIVTWFIYDLLWESPIAKNNTLAMIISFALLSAMTYFLYQVMSPRGAFMHVGAVLGTIMWANVRVRIIPAQVKMIAGANPGQELTEQAKHLAKNSKRRSNHNNYMTLPVLLVMISNHFASVYAHQYAWLVVLALFLIGAAFRHSINLHHKGKPYVWILPVATIAFVILFIVANPSKPKAIAAAGPTAVENNQVAFADVQSIINERCITCHSATPTHPLAPIAPKGVMFDTAEQIVSQANLIETTTVISKIMPLANLTQITDEERELLANWIKQGAKQ